MSKQTFPLDRLMDRMMENIEAWQSKWPTAEQVLTSGLETGIATTPYDVVYKEDRVKLKHYRPLTDPDEYRTPLFIVYAQINRETMLDLQPDRSVVQNLLRNGIDLYMLDWGYPSRKDRFLTIDDHVNGYINNAVDVILQREGLSQLNLMGVCMGGSFCTMYTSLHPHKVKNLILTVTPTNFETDQGLLHTWWGNPNFDVDRLVNLQGNIAGDLLNINFLLMNPPRLMIDKYTGFLQNLDDKKFVENFMRMEKWIFDSPDVPGETFRQFIKDCYQKNLLIQNKMELGDQRVDLKQITMPVLNFYGLYDHLVPPEACDKICGAVGSTDTEEVPLKTGHIGIYVSSKSQKEFVPKICQWLKDRDTAELKSAKKSAKKSARKSPAGKTAKAGQTKTAVKKGTEKNTPRQTGTTE
ncbi:MAG: class III poly(R)-hydroxyalkanoic acid synthase subunit PhaC [Desulfohalobiaceae bacterium]|nr:class III poly(R)-hydroxyalkanoic acid synthase subunit PhaC [Desulfohalobiaceae bacterium]